MYANITIVGGLGRDPELKSVNGKSVCEFSVGVKDGENTEWFKVSIWGKKGEACKNHLVKGSKVLASGKFQVQKYQKEGVEKQAFVVQANDVVFLSPKPASSGGM